MLAVMPVVLHRVKEDVVVAKITQVTKPKTSQMTSCDLSGHPLSPSR